MRTKIASMKYLLYFIAAVMMFGSSGIVASTLPLSAFEVCHRPRRFFHADRQP